MLNAPSMSSYISMSARAACFATLFDARPVRFGVGSSSTTPFEYDVDRFASLPEALFAEPLTNGLDTMRFGVSSFRRFEERGESSMAAIDA